MKRLFCTLILLAVAGCVTPPEKKSDPAAPNKTVSRRAITADMVTPDNGKQIARELNDLLDSEEQGEAKTPAKKK